MSFVVPAAFNSFPGGVVNPLKVEMPNVKTYRALVTVPTSFDIIKDRATVHFAGLRFDHCITTEIANYMQVNNVRSGYFEVREHICRIKKGRVLEVLRPCP